MEKLLGFSSLPSKEEIFLHCLCLSESLVGFDISEDPVGMAMRIRGTVVRTRRMEWEESKVMSWAAGGPCISMVLSRVREGRRCRCQCVSWKLARMF